MSDLRATERLLEVIEERIDRRIARDADTGAPMADLNAIKDEIQELRRRGDTLVRRDDLRMVLECVEQDAYILGQGNHLKAYDRLQIAIGGRLR